MPSVSTSWSESASRLGNLAGANAVSVFALPGLGRRSLFLRYLFRLSLSLDANFRLDSLFRSSAENDPWLGNGSAYFVEDGPYNQWVLEHTNEDEVRCCLFIKYPSHLLWQMSTCAGFAALLKANVARTKGLRSTGVGAVMCVHDCWRPNGMGDLQKGERCVTIKSICFRSDIFSGTVIWISYGFLR